MDQRRAQLAIAPSGRTHSAGKLQSLQAMRGLAALLVVISHTMRQTHEIGLNAATMFQPALFIGQLGVCTFFVISGFIMQYTAGATFGRPGASIKFISRRVARIVPLYWLFTALAIAFPSALYLGRNVPIASALFSFAFLPDMTNSPSLYPALVVGWSLTFEMLFYGAFAFALRLPARIGTPALLISLTALVPLMRLIGIFTAASPNLQKFALWWAQDGLFLFAVGVMLAMLEAKRRRQPDSRNLGFYAATVVLVGCAMWFTVANATLSVGLQKIMTGLVPIIVISLCVLSQDLRAGPLSQLLVWLGDRSYGLYLGHLFVLGILFEIWQLAVGMQWLVLYEAVAVVACCVSCWPFYAFVESPLTRSARALVLVRAAPSLSGSGN